MTVDVTDAVVMQLAIPVAAAIPGIVARIPAGPAAELGRLGAPPEAPPHIPEPQFRPVPMRAPTPAPVNPIAPRPADPGQPVRLPGLTHLDQLTHLGGGEAVTPSHAVSVVFRAGSPADSPALGALGDLGPMLAERLLGALELTVAGLELTGTPDLSPYVGQPPTGRIGFLSSRQQSAAGIAARLLDRLRPGFADLVASLARRLAADQSIAALLAGAAATDDEPAIAAAHGAGHLALAVATATAVFDQVRAPGTVDRSAAVLGTAIGTAALLLRAAPMPAGYAPALLAKVRAEYLLPRGSAGSVPVAGHRFGLVEGELPDEVDVTGNGLVAVVPGGAVIRTGIAEGRVRVQLSVLAEPPAEVSPGWDEVVEVSWRAATGQASVTGSEGTGERQLCRQTPPWPGDYRLRVHARGRDDSDQPGAESYELVVWPAPEAPEVVHARTDRLGYRLRDEPEPVRVEPPEHAYRWVRRTALGEAATVTVVTGSTVEQVLRAFGADPQRPESRHGIDEDLFTRASNDPWVAVLDTGDAVLAVEYNGFQGSREPVLCRASQGGRAASMLWNVNALTRLSFAEQGRVLASFEPWGEIDAEPAVAAALIDLDFDDHGDRVGKGLTAVARFTGRGITAEDLERIEAADIAFWIVPDLPTLYPYRPHPHGLRLLGGPAEPAILDDETVSRLPEPRLRDLAWWLAGEAARHAGLAGDPDIVASITARTLTPGALDRARRSQLDGGQHRWLWLALHRATNPDARAAAVEAFGAARFAAGPHAAELVDGTRQRITD